MAFGIARLFSRVTEATASKSETAAALKAAKRATGKLPKKAAAQDHIATPTALSRQTDRKAASLEDAKNKFQKKKLKSDADNADASKSAHDVMLDLPKVMNDPNTIRVGLSNIQKAFRTDHDDFGNPLNKDGTHLGPFASIQKGMVDGIVEQRATSAGMSAEKYADPSFTHYLKASKSTIAPLAAPAAKGTYKIFKATISANTTTNAAETTARRAEKLRQLNSGEAQVVPGKLGIGSKRIYNQEAVKSAVEATREKHVSTLYQAEKNAVQALQKGPEIKPIQGPTSEQDLIAQHKQLQGAFSDAYDARTAAQSHFASSTYSSLRNDPEAQSTIHEAAQAAVNVQYSAAAESLGKYIGRGIDVDAASNILVAQSKFEQEASKFLPVHQKLIDVKNERHLNESLDPHVDQETGDVFYDAQESQSVFEKQGFVSSVLWPNKQTQALHKTHQEMQEFYNFGSDAPTDISLIPSTTRQFVDRGISFLLPRAKNDPNEIQ